MAGSLRLGLMTRAVVGGIRDCDVHQNRIPANRAASTTVNRSVSNPSLASDGLRASSIAHRAFLLRTDARE